MTYSLAVQPAIRRRSHLKEFTLFPMLPMELRLKIWKTSTFISRVVPIAPKDIGKMPITGERIFKYISPVQVPAMLHTSQESREEGLKHYKREFAVVIYGYDMSIFIEGKIYVNFMSDTIWPLGPFTFKSFHDFCRRDILHIAVCVDPFENPADLPHCLVQENAFDFLRVKTVALCHPSCYDPRVPIDLEAPIVKAMGGPSSGLSAEESQYGLVWAKEEIERVFADREKECLQRAKRNKDDKERGGPGSEQTEDDIVTGTPWVRPTVEIMTIVQQRPVGWPVNGWFVMGVDRFQPDD